KLGLIGHSEGGLIATIVASKRNDIAFIILLAAPGVPINKLMFEQTKAYLLAESIDSQAVKSFLPIYQKILSLIINYNDKDYLYNSIYSVLHQWRETTPYKYVESTTKIVDSITEKEFIYNMINQMTNPWFQYFLHFDPQSY